MLKVRVFRGTDLSVPRYDSYEVPLPADGSCSVMDVLDYIYENLDGTLSYYRHSVCNQGICGRCGVKTNGKNGLACVTKVLCDELVLEPKNNKPVKDLVTE